MPSGRKSLKGVRERKRAERDARYLITRTQGLPPSVAHGYNAYRNWGCRCDFCVEAFRNYKRADRHNKKLAQGKGKLSNNPARVLRDLWNDDSDRGGDRAISVS